MFGRNETLPRVKDSGETLAVQEIFRTIQGEGPDAGTPATFVRLWGCHLKCWFCDTDFESNRQDLPISAIMERCSGGPRLVVLTGGEPLRQSIAPLIYALLDQAYALNIETAGSFWFPRVNTFLPLRDKDTFKVIVSPKTPSVNADLARIAYFKYVISANAPLSEDGLPVVNYQEKGGTPRPLARPPWLKQAPHRVFVQPMDEQDIEKNQRNRDLCVGIARQYGYRLSLQLHKILDLP